MKDLLYEIVKALVDQPDLVSVNEVEGGHTIVLELKVAKSEMGKVLVNGADMPMPSGLS